MTPDAAFWILSTIAQVAAALVGLVLIAVVFFLGELKGIFRGTKPVQKYISMGLVAGPLSKFLFIIILTTGITLVIGITTSLRAVLAIGDIGEIVDDTLIQSINDVQVGFSVFMILIMVIAFLCLVAGARIHMEEVRDFEKLMGGPKEVKKTILTACPRKN